MVPPSVGGGRVALHSHVRGSHWLCARYPRIIHTAATPRKTESPARSLLLLDTGGGRLWIVAAALTPLRPLMNPCCITAAVRHCCHCLVRVCSRRRCLRWVLLAGCRWQICSCRCHLLWGNHSAGGSNECGWRPRWHTTLTLVAHTCWVSRPLHGAASLLPGCCCCCCCCCRRAVTSTSTLSAAVASRASQWAASASVGGGRVRLSARTPAAPACCVLASVSRRVPAANTAVLCHCCCARVRAVVVLN